MTDWWNTPTPTTGETEKPVIAPGWEPEPVMAPPRPPAPPAQDEPETPEPNAPDRRRTLVLGAAGAAVVGILVFAVMPHGGSESTADPAKVSSQAPDGSLPAAGGGPAGMPEEDKDGPSRGSQTAAPKTVVITASPTGKKGQVGAIVEVTIENNTDDPLTVMPSLVKGDGHPAVIGEGTLAPGLLKVEPGETGKGTVEFAASKAPSQVALVDLSGNVVAASR